MREFPGLSGGAFRGTGRGASVVDPLAAAGRSKWTPCAHRAAAGNSRRAPRTGRAAIARAGALRQRAGESVPLKSRVWRTPAAQIRRPDVRPVRATGPLRRIRLSFRASLAPPPS